MANTSLPNLTERTATANSDLIHVNSGGTDYKETKGNFLSDVNSSISALNNSLTKTSASLTAGSGVTLESSSKVTRIGNICELQIDCSKTQFAEDDIIATIPSGYRPQIGTIFTPIHWYTTTTDNAVAVIVNNGQVKVWSKGNQPFGKIHISCVYFRSS